MMEDHRKITPVSRIKCDACYRKLSKGENWYEMRKSGAILCAADLATTTTDTVAYKGTV